MTCGASKLDGFARECFSLQRAANEGRQPPPPSWGRASALGELASLEAEGEGVTPAAMALEPSAISARVTPSPRFSKFAALTKRNGPPPTKGEGVGVLHLRRGRPTPGCPMQLTPPPPVPAIRDLRLAFRGAGGDSEVLHGISLHVNAGEKVALVGESGSGKSVTARLAMGLLQGGRGVRVSGSILFTGVEVARGGARDRGAARQPGDHDLPGPDLGAQSDLHHPQPVPPRCCARAIAHCRNARRTRRRRPASPKCRSTTRGACSTPMPSSSPAA